jgi:hypothetical protein
MTVVDEKKYEGKERYKVHRVGEGIDNMTKKPLSDYWGVGEVYCFIGHLAILAMKGS